MGSKRRNQREQIKDRLAVSGRVDRCLGPWKKCLVEPFQTPPVAKVPGIEENDQRHSDQNRPDNMSNREPRSPLQAVLYWRGFACNARVCNALCSSWACNVRVCNALACRSRACNARLQATPLRRQSTQHQNEKAGSGEPSE